MANVPTDAQAEALRKFLGALHDAKQFGDVAYLPCFLYLGRNEWSGEAVEVANEIQGLYADCEEELRTARGDVLKSGYDAPGIWLSASLPDIRVNDNPTGDPPVVEIDLGPPHPCIDEAIHGVVAALERWEVLRGEQPSKESPGVTAGRAFVRHHDGSPPPPDEIERLKDLEGLPRIRPLAPPDIGTETISPPILTDQQQEAFDYIRDHGPKFGKEICRELGISSESTFTSHYVPALKLHGVRNRRGAGYYLDESCR
mgnify:CR=1 FL=1